MRYLAASAKILEHRCGCKVQDKEMNILVDSSLLLSFVKSIILVLVLMRVRVRDLRRRYR